MSQFTKPGLVICDILKMIKLQTCIRDLNQGYVVYLHSIFCYSSTLEYTDSKTSKIIKSDLPSVHSLYIKYIWKRVFKLSSNPSHLARHTASGKRLMINQSASVKVPFLPPSKNSTPNRSHLQSLLLLLVRLSVLQRLLHIYSSQKYTDKLMLF